MSRFWSSSRRSRIVSYARRRRKERGDMRLGTRTVALVTILALYSGTSVQATPNLTGYPNSMAATGDSITRAYNTGTLPFSDRPDNSWSTGTRTSVGSH
jgi:hypothetical protein